MPTPPSTADPPSPPDTELRRGYWFWGIVIALILAVEAAGAIGSSNWYKEHVLEDHSWAKIPWTTISGMVGHLEELFSGTAVVVLALITPAAFYALAPLPPPPPNTDRTDLGRVYVGAAPTKRLHWYSVWTVLILSAIVGFLAVRFSDDDFHRAYWIYGALFFFGILVPSLLLFAHMEPGFTSLFTTVGAVRQRRDFRAVVATVALAAGLGILAIHLAFYPWPDITKEPLRYAGLTARQARSKAATKIRQSQQEESLVYSTQARDVVNNAEAWSVFFRATDPDKPGCVVIVQKETVDARACGIT